MVDADQPQDQDSSNPRQPARQPYAGRANEPGERVAADRDSPSDGLQAEPVSAVHRPEGTGSISREAASRDHGGAASPGDSPGAEAARRADPAGRNEVETPMSGVSLAEKLGADERPRNMPLDPQSSGIGPLPTHVAILLLMLVVLVAAYLVISVAT